MTPQIRLACQHCDTDECDGVTEIPPDWSDVQEVQGFAASCEPIAADDQTRSPSYTVVSLPRLGCGLGVRGFLEGTFRVMTCCFLVLDLALAVIFTRLN